MPDTDAGGVVANTLLPATLASRTNGYWVPKALYTPSSCRMFSHPNDFKYKYPTESAVAEFRGMVQCGNPSDAVPSLSESNDCTELLSSPSVTTNPPAAVKAASAA